MKSPKKIKFLKGEKVSVLPWKKTPKGHRYAITNLGRTISFTDDVNTGRLLKSANLGGYPGISFRIGDENRSINIHRLVAQEFVKQPSKKHKKVIHLNFKKDDNHYKNLKWVTVEQQFAHDKQNPNYADRGGNFKLNAVKVKEIKTSLQKGKFTLRQIAKKYKVSDMQIYRIRTGENWSHIKI